jgi:F420H(2)-dependent quinone reductase
MALDLIRETARGLAERIGGTHLGVLVIGRVVSPLQRWLYRLTGGRISLTGRAPVLLLTTTGRRTGKARTVPLLYVRDGDRMVICNVNPGFERPNPWILNLRAQPRAQVQIGSDTIPVRARPASANELDQYWPRLARLWPAYQTFFDRGGKRSVFLLEPDSRAGRGGQIGPDRTEGPSGDMGRSSRGGEAASSAGEINDGR